ncbi:MAG TPA: orotidine 5'-phosphate decarboxylase, partial [Paraburkholderia sp.]
MTSFTQTLSAAWQRTGSLLCVGLDPEPTKFPAAL